MRLRAIEIEQLGPYQSAAFAFERQGLHIVYGANEAGKSTLLAAVRGGLFGVPKLTEGQVGIRPGSLVRFSVEHEDGLFSTVERTLTRKSPPKLQLHTGESMAGQTALLEVFPELRGIEQMLFETFFTVQLADLVAFSERPQVMANQLFGVRAPLLNPYQFEDALERKAREIYIPSSRASRPTLNQLQREYESVRQKLKNCHDSAPWYEQTVSRRHQLQQQLEIQSDRLVQLEDKRQTLEQAIEYQRDVKQLLELENEMRSLGMCPTGTYATWKEAGTLLEQLSESRQQMAMAEKERLEIERQMASLAVSEPWLGVRSVLPRLQADILQAEQTANELQLSRDDEANGQRTQQMKSYPLPDAWAEETMLSAALKTEKWAALVKHASIFEEQKRRVQGVAEQVQVSRTLAEEHKDAVQKRMNLEMENVDEAMAWLQSEKAKAERLQVEVSDDVRILERWQAKNRDAEDARNRSPRIHLIPVVGAGVILLVGAFIDYAQGVDLGGLFFACAAALAFVNAFLFRSLFLRRWDGRNRRTSRLPIDELTHMPDPGETAADMLNRMRGMQLNAERSSLALFESEQFLAAWQQTTRHVQAREAELSSARASQRDAEADYHMLLKDWHLSAHDWTAAELDKLSRAAQGHLDAKTAIDRACVEGREHEAKLKQLLDRIQETVHAHHDTCAIQGEELTALAIAKLETNEDVRLPLSLLRELADRWTEEVNVAVNDHVEWISCVGRRDRLDHEIEMQQRQMTEAAEHIRVIFTALGVEHVDAYEAVMTREKRRLQLSEAREKVLHHLTVACGGERQAARLVSRVNTDPLARIEHAFTQMAEACTKASEEMKSTQEQIWEADSALSKSAVETEGARLRFELAKLEAAIHEAKEAYLSCVLAKSFSKWARARVESNRVSPVLELASSYLCEMTYMRYRELRIPIGDDGMKRIYVRDAQGNNWGLDALSRGTREQVYLALRLAAVREYRAKGVILPVILDDPLVNFDDERARKVFDLLCVEARQQPIIYLTCHRRFLDELSTDTRVHMVNS